MEAGCGSCSIAKGDRSTRVSSHAIRLRATGIDGYALRVDRRSATACGEAIGVVTGSRNRTSTRERNDRSSFGSDGVSPCAAGGN
ncbi:hypothetical protein D3C85_1074240 [compost metagenome]